VGRAARDALAHAFTWTGVLNGAAVRMTDVWPNVTAPFALFFGINEPPGPDDGFYYYSPYLEKGVNDRGRLRVDAKEAHPVRLEALERTPYLLKVLFRGSALDLDVMRTVAKAGPTVEEYWQGKLGLQLGQGYQVALSSGRRDASFLMNLPDVTATTVGRTPLIDLSALPLFRKPELCWPRQPEIYKGPLVLVRESILADPRRPSVFLATQDAAFSRSFYGFSAFGHPQATDLTRYLALILAAPLMRWYGLMTSSKYGVERDVLLFEDVRRFPIPPLDDLAPDLRQAVPELWASYARERRVTSSHEAWAQEVYGLTADDWQVVTDTLEVGGPQAGVAKRASASPSRREVLAFGQVLRSVLETALGEKIAVKAGELPASSPWQFVWLTPALQSGKAAGKDRPGPWLTMLADAYAASATHVVREGGVLVCRLRQYRYWTPSRARLTALELLRDAEATSALVST
ncbi:hypothetical protein L6R53_02765, partial [Myxococcota bacterium]|nr:hypothetical protein [Myxococcota bacterium]